MFWANLEASGLTEQRVGAHVSVLHHGGAQTAEGWTGRERAMPASRCGWEAGSHCSRGLLVPGNGNHSLAEQLPCQWPQWSYFSVCLRTPPDAGSTGPVSGDCPSLSLSLYRLYCPPATGSGWLLGGVGGGNALLFPSGNAP